jgi:excisionase family DNA binding protein
MSQTVLPKLAYSIGELAACGPVGRSTIYNAIAAGRLRARKIGRRTIVLDEDWRAFLTDAPIVARPIPPAPPPRQCAGRAEHRKGSGLLL